MESPDSFLETTKEIGEKASGVARQARLTKDRSLRNVDSMRSPAAAPKCYRTVCRIGPRA